MSQTQIANRYAKALFILAHEESSLDSIYFSLQDLGVLLKENLELRSFIYNPLFSPEQRAHIIQRVFDNKAPKLLFKFLMFLNLKKRLNIIHAIVDSFDELYLEQNNQMRVDLQTSLNLQDDQKQNIERALNNKYNKEISLNCHIKPELLGGFRLLAGGTLFDGSIKSQLEQFRQKVLV